MNQKLRKFASNLLITAMCAGTLALTGCASSVSRPNDASGASRVVALTPQAPAVSLNVDASAEAKEANSDGKFDLIALRTRMASALENQNLLNKELGKATINVKIVSLRIRGTFVAVFFGVLAGPDTVVAEVTVTNPDGKQLDKFTISASYLLGGAAGGQDGSRIGWMQEKLTEHLVSQFKPVETAAAK